MKYKINDFVFFEYELAQIKEMEDNRITEVSTGYIRTSGNDLSYACFPLSIEQIRVSDCFTITSKELHNLGGNLNYPGIHRHMVALWIKANECIDNVEECNKVLERLSDFKIKIIESTKSLRDVCIDGVRLYR